jgi:hypothetical protein
MTDCYSRMQERDKDITGEIDKKMEVLKEKIERQDFTFRQISNVV